MRTIFSLLLVSLACTPPAEDSAPVSPQAPDSTADSGDSAEDTSPPVTDADGDGYDAEAWGGDDCDDDDPDVNPGASETWYDGVDSDCSGGSDYDADGDGEDAEDHGGADCDDTDASVQEDCPETDSELTAYAYSSYGEIKEIAMNLSGITWNPVTETFMAVLDGNRTLFELDENMVVLREISLTNVDHPDTEDIVYLDQGDDETPSYAIVTEEGVVYVGDVPDDGGSEIDFEDWQTITYAADDAGNSGGEGIAYDADTRTFWVCKEKDPMGVQSFARPATDADVSYEDGGLVVTEAFDADKLLAQYASDLASCAFDARTGRLLLLSQESDVVLDVGTDGALFGTLDIDEAPLTKPEGLTLMTEGDLILVGEPNQWVRYEYGEP